MKNINYHLFKKLKRICLTKYNVQAKELCTIGIGGIVSFVCYPKKLSQLKKLLKFLIKSKVEYFPLGNGSNIVFGDGVCPKVAISLKRLNKINLSKNKVSAMAGVSLFSLLNLALKHNLGGLEFAYGIPASLGGVVTMNAGAFLGQMSDVVERVWAFDGDKIKVYPKDKCQFGYRESIFKIKKLIVFKVELSLKGNEKDIDIKYKQNMEKRLATQPYVIKNAGSVFKKCEGDSAGKIIDNLGLKGAIIGHMQISPTHANFFVNLGGATCQNFKDLCTLAEQSAKKSLGVNLEREVIIIE